MTCKNFCAEQVLMRYYISASRRILSLNTARLTLICLTLLLLQNCVTGTVLAATTTGRRLAAVPSNSNRIATWFDNYDNIRRQAQLSPADRAEADALLGKGMSILTAGPDKEAAHAMLQKMVGNYAVATGAMQSLPVLPETEPLRQGYYQYFATAKNLFGDYLTVQDNFFAQDANGKPVIQTLMERKEQLEQLNTYVHDLDDKTRAQYGIPPYRY
jgi:hypothetical protein